MVESSVKTCVTVPAIFPFWNKIISDTANNILAVIGSFVNSYLVEKLGKRKSLIGCIVLSIIGSAIVGFSDTAIPGVLLGVAIHGLAMIPDIVDYSEWKTGIRSEGLVTCCVSFGLKIGIGVGGAVATWVLALGGYEGTAVTQAALAVSAVQSGYLTKVLETIYQAAETNSTIRFE